MKDYSSALFLIEHPGVIIQQQSLPTTPPEALSIRLWVSRLYFLREKRVYGSLDQGGSQAVDFIKDYLLSHTTSPLLDKDRFYNLDFKPSMTLDRGSYAMHQHQLEHLCTHSEAAAFRIFPAKFSWHLCKTKLSAAKQQLSLGLRMFCVECSKVLFDSWPKLYLKFTCERIMQTNKVILHLQGPRKHIKQRRVFIFFGSLILSDKTGLQSIARTHVDPMNFKTRQNGSHPAHHLIVNYLVFHRVA